MQFFISLGAVNLLLVCVYLVPLWSRESLRVLNSPFGALHEHPHAAVVDFFRHSLGLGLDGMLVMAKMLAGFKLLIVAAMVAFLIDFVRAIAERREPDRATINTVLTLAFLLVLTLAVPVVNVDDVELVQSCAAQIMLVSGAVVVTTVEREAERCARPVPSSVPVVHEEPAEVRLAA